MNSPDLGKKCWTLQVAVRGDTTLAAAQKVVDAIIEAIGMTPVFKPTAYQYEGDIGIIYIQPIYESFVGFDAWPCHGGGYLTITSCREFSATTALTAIRANGYEIVGQTPTPTVLEI